MDRYQMVYIGYKPLAEANVIEDLEVYDIIT